MLAGLGGLALIGFMFLDWFAAGGVAVPGLPDVSGIQDQIPGAASQDIPGVDAWQSLEFVDFILLLTGVAGISLAALTATGRRLNVPVTKGVIADVLGGLSVLLIIWRIFDPPASGDLKIGIFLGLIAAAAVSLGGYLTARAEGFDFYAPAGGGRSSGSSRSSSGSTTRKRTTGGSRSSSAKRSTTRKK